MSRALTPRSPLVSDALPPQFHQIFPYKSFNAIQTECQSAFTSDENLVVSAPTGSGKTAILELAVCRAIFTGAIARQPTRKGTSLSPSAPSPSRKVVYLAPIRALVSEKEALWKSTFRTAGLRIVTTVGDEEDGRGPSIKQVMDADVVLSTPEKWDVLTRGQVGSENEHLAASVCLLLIDEVHHLGDSRGDALEAVVTRLMAAGRYPPLSEATATSQGQVGTLRIVAVSATVPNLTEVAFWLQAKPTNCKVFSQSHRPVPLETHVLGYRSKNVWTFNNYIVTRCFDVIHKYSEGRPTIVFCTSKKMCLSAANAFVASSTKGSRTGFRGASRRGGAMRTDKEEVALIDAAKAMSDSVNSGLLRHGAAVHHADISEADKHVIEDMFRRRVLHVLFTTTTLAQGVNLPARLCVILGTTVYRGGGLTEIDRSLVVQMLGRAGRPGFDTKGTAVVITSVEKAGVYRSICSGSLPQVKSQIESKVSEHLNAEVARGAVKGMKTGLAWLRMTFLSAQKMLAGGPAGLKRTEDYLLSHVGLAMKSLSKVRLIRHDPQFEQVNPCSGSFTMARLVVRQSTMAEFAGAVNHITSPCDVMRVICNTSEMTDGLFLRRNEKKHLQALDEEMKHPLRKKIETTPEKVFVLLQSSMNCPGVAIKDFTLANEAKKVVNVAKRMSCAFAEFLTESEISVPFTATWSAVQVARTIATAMFWDSSVVLQQLDGISRDTAKKLFTKGIRTFKDLSDASAREVERLAQRPPPFGEKARKALSSMSRLHGRVEVVNTRDTDSNSSGIELNVCVTISSWDVGMGNKRGDFRGFILVGSHSSSVAHFSNINLPRDNGQSGEQTFEVSVRIKRGVKKSQWVDVLAGSHRFYGVDFHHRVHLPAVHSAKSGHLECPRPMASARGGGMKLPVTVESSDATRNGLLPESAKSNETIGSAPELCELAMKKTLAPPRSSAPVCDIEDHALGVKAILPSRTPRSQRASCYDGLVDVTQRSRPFTASLPVKRLRTAEPARAAAERGGRRMRMTQMLKGTRLNAFIPCDPVSSSDAHSLHEAGTCQNEEEVLPSLATPMILDLTGDSDDEEEDAAPSPKSQHCLAGILGFLGATEESKNATKTCSIFDNALPGGYPLKGITPMTLPYRWEKESAEPICDE